jgi:Arc/MetJ-type ribon-helix-helix transcriptional regulator
MEATKASSTESYDVITVPRQRPPTKRPYTTVAVGPETKSRMEEAKRRNQFRSMDELVNASLDQLDMKTLVRDVRHLARRGRAAMKRSREVAEFEEAMQGIDKTSAWLRGKGPMPPWVRAHYGTKRRRRARDPGA